MFWIWYEYLIVPLLAYYLHLLSSYPQGYADNLSSSVWGCRVTGESGFFLEKFRTNRDLTNITTTPPCPLGHRVPTVVQPGTWVLLYICFFYERSEEKKYIKKRIPGFEVVTRWGTLRSPVGVVFVVMLWEIHLLTRVCTRAYTRTHVYILVRVLMNLIPGDLRHG